MLTLEKAKVLLNKYSFSPRGPAAEGYAVNAEMVEALQTVIRLYKALEDEIMGFQGPFLPMDPTDVKGIEDYNKAIQAWATRRREHWVWVEENLEKEHFRKKVKAKDPGPTKYHFQDTDDIPFDDET